MASALSIAVRDGDDGAVRRLLQADASAVEKTDAQQALRDASELGRLSVVNALLSAGVDVDATSTDGRTALHLAAIQGHVDVVTRLLEAPADVEKRTAQTSATPLLAACIGGSVAVVQLLIDHGADVLATNAHGWTALHVAAERGHVDLVQYLLESHSGRLKVDTRHQADGTALHVASWCGHSRIVQLLIQAGASIDSTQDNGLAALQLACQAGHKNVATVLLQAGASVDTVGVDGRSALHHACWSGQLEVVDLLVDGGAMINHRDRDGYSPLHVACRYGHESAVKRLIEARADLEVTDAHGCTPLLSACFFNHPAIALLLLDAGADYTVSMSLPNVDMAEVTPLHLAAINNNANLATALVRVGAATDARQKDGTTPLHHACRSGAVEIARLLIDKGADVNAKAEEGCTCLHMAAMSECLEIVQLLLAAGCDIDARIKNEDTALDCACYSGCVVVIQALVQAGARIHWPDNINMTPLHSAALYGRVDAAQLLIDLGVNMNVKNKGGTAPLHIAAYRGHADFAKFLIDAGAEINSITKDGWTPLMIACRSGHAQIVELLQAAGAKEDVSSGEHTPLHAACRGGMLNIVKSLVAAGFNVDATLSDGTTPLHEACFNGHVDVVEFLLEISKESINATTTFGCTPLLVALDRGKKDVAEILLKFGAEMCDASSLQPIVAYGCETGNIDGIRLIMDRCVVAENVIDALDLRELMHRACASESLPLVQYLLSKGMDVNGVSTGDEQLTPLHIAAASGHVGIVHALVVAGANVQATDRNGSTAMDKAVHRHHWIVMKELIKAGASLTTPLKNGLSYLHLECQRGDKQGVKAMLECGADVNALDNVGQSPIMVASEAGQGGIVQLLLAAGAKVHLMAKDGRTAIHKASAQGHWEVVQELIACGALYSPRSPSYDISYFDAAFDCKDVSRMLTVVWLLARHVRELDPSTVLDLMKRSYDATAVEAMSVCLKQWVIERADHSDLTVVPVEVFDLGGAAVASYLKDLSISTVALYRHKLCVIGPQAWGKTSLVRSLSSGHVALERAQDRTIGIDVVPWQFERRSASGIEERHEVTWWDFAGQDVYLAAHTVFYSRRAVFLVVVDLSAYERVLQSGESQREKIHESTMRAFVENTLLQRLRIIVARQPDASFIFVGTKADAVTSEQSLCEIKNDLTLRLHMWQDDWIVRDDQTFDGCLQRIGVVSRLADAPWLFVSCADQQSLESFSRDLQGLILSRRMGFRVPDKYAVVLERLDERRRIASASSSADRIAALCVKELSLRLWLKSEVSSEFDDDECKQVLRIFHDLGELLWFENEAGGSLSRYVFLSPKLVIDFVRDAINHAYVESDDISAMTGLPETVRSNESVTAWLTSIRQTGRIPHALLMNMEHWRNADQDLVLAVKQLLNSVGLAYPAESQVMKWDSDLIAPAYWQMEADTSSEHRQFEPLSTLLELSPTTSAVLSEQYIEYEFVAARLPSTLFEQLIVHSFTPGVTRITTNQFVAQTVGDESVLRISWFGGGRGPSAGHRVRVESMAVTKALSTRVLHFGCMVIERALESYPGIQPVREDVRIEQGDAVSFATVEATEWYRKKHWRIPGALNAFPRLLPTETMTPISLSLDVTNGSLPTVDWRGCYVDWSLRHPNHGEALGFRRCQLPLDDAMQPDWSSLSVSFSKVPAMPLLRDCRLEVSFLRSGWLCCLAPRSLVSGEGTFRDVVPDESLALMQGVEMSISLKQHHLVDGSGDGYMRLQFSCQAMESKSTAAAPGLPSPAA